MTDPKLIEFCETDEDKRRIQAWIDKGEVAAHAALELGIDEASVRRTLKKVKHRASRQGHSPDHDMQQTVPDGYHIKGTSTLYDKHGKPKLQWVKSNIDHERQQELMREAIAVLSEDLPKLSKTEKPKHINSDLMAVYPLGDPHIGMLAWAEETGQDWDLKIAESKFCAAFDRVVKSAPSCDRAVIVNLGDFFHADNLEGVTTRSGHALDLDGRFAKMIRIGVKIIRQMIASALEHHKTVHVINAIGNHDDTGAIFLSVALKAMYENEPRLTVDDSPSPFHYFQFGKCMFGVHHGHTCKAAKLPGVMATDQPVMWGATVHRVWLTGHIHHDTKKEESGCVVESFRTLAAKDAYATWGGYRAMQDTKCLVIHKEHGEIERHTVNLGMLE